MDQEGALVTVTAKPAEANPAADADPVRSGSGQDLGRVIGLGTVSKSTCTPVRYSPVIGDNGAANPP